jgi:hypothetical protein
MISNKQWRVANNAEKKDKYYNSLVPSSSDKNKFRTDNDTFYTETFPVKVICINTTKNLFPILRHSAEWSVVISRQSHLFHKLYQ